MRRTRSSRWFNNACRSVHASSIGESSVVQSAAKTSSRIANAAIRPNLPSSQVTGAWNVATLRGDLGANDELVRAAIVQAGDRRGEVGVA